MNFKKFKLASLSLLLAGSLVACGTVDKGKTKDSQGNLVETAEEVVGVDSKTGETYKEGGINKTSTSQEEGTKEESSANSNYVFTGAALSTRETEKVMELFKLSNGRKLVANVMTGKLYDEAMHESGSKDSSMYSSVAVEPNEEKGISVEILTPENITKVKDWQYSSAAITAGLKDANIKVVATSPVTGESALAGVIKSAEAISSTQISSEKVEAAKSELSTVITVTEAATKGQSEEEAKTTEAQIVKALNEIKTEIAELRKTRDSENVSKAEVKGIVTKTLSDKKVSVPDEEIDKLVDSMVKYKDSLTREDIENVVNQIKKFGEGVFNFGKDAFDKAVEKGWFEKIGDWIRNLGK